MDTQQTIEKLGWQVEYEGSGILGHQHHCRAFQGGFKTLWRDTPEEVLADVQKLQEARKKSVGVPF